MDCNDAGELMMKYMDRVLTEAEASKLNLHLKECEACREDFLIYDGMMRDFDGLEIVCAPEHFEAGVMARIAELPPLNTANAYSLDAIACAVWGIFSVLMGAGFMLFLNQDTIITYLSGNPLYNGYIELLQPVLVYVTLFTENLVTVSRDFFTQTGEWISTFRYVLVFLFAVLTLMQVIIHKRDKVEV